MNRAHRHIPAHNRYNAVLLAVVCLASFAFAAENILTFTSAVTANDFLRTGDTLWVATSGGLSVHNTGSGEKTLISNTRIFPDPHLTALARDKNGNLWIGSQRGYLYRMTPRGQFTTYSNYKGSGWGVLSLHFYDKFLVVGTDKGLSLFDPGAGTAVKNAVKFRNFANARVNAIASSADTLFLGCDEGVAYLGGLAAEPLAHKNFYDPGIWSTRPAARAVVGFVDSAGATLAKDVPSAMFRNHMFSVERVTDTYDTVWVLVNRDTGNGERRWYRWLRVTSFPDRIVSLYNEDDRRLWIGTEDKHYFSYDGETALARHEYGGYSLRQGTRIAADGTGSVWVLPMQLFSTASWHHAIYRYDGRDWHRYNRDTHGHKFGYMGDGMPTGITAGSGGTLWAGTSGGNIKFIDPHRDIIGVLVVGNRDFTNIGYYTDGVGNDNWGKIDALALDSAGYLWISAFDHNSGSILCYDPRSGGPKPDPSLDPSKAGFRWFFNEFPLKTTNITELSADPNNRIFAYDNIQNRLTIFSHGGNPLKDSIKIDATYAGFGAVTAIRSAPDGTTYIAGTMGLMKAAPGAPTVAAVDTSLSDIASMAVQGNVLWLGTHSNGVLRYDLASGAKKRIGEAQGLHSDNVVSVALDGKNGFLWALTDGALSRVDIGRPVSAAKKEDMRVFPNVFSVSRRNQGASAVTFSRLEPQSAVSVFSVGGALVAKVKAEHFSGDEWRAAWTPRRNLAPGTYIAVAKPSGKRAKIILKP